MGSDRLIPLDPLYGVAFSHSPLHPNRVALTSYSTGPSNKLFTVDTPQDDSSYSSSSGYQQLASANLQLPATKVAWEPRESLPHDGHGGGGRGELIATSGDMLRLWEVNEGGGYDDGSGYIGRGWSNGGGAGGYTLNARGVLTNVSWMSLWDRQGKKVIGRGWTWISQLGQS